LDYCRTADIPSVVQFWETWEEEDPWGKTHLASTFEFSFKFLKGVFGFMPK